MSALPEPSPDFQRESAALRRIARGIVFERGLADDAVQEAWLAALRTSPTCAVPGGWLNEAVRRIARGLRRQEARQVAREQHAARPESVPSASETSARLELLRELLAALEALEEPYRTAVQMRLVDDLPPRTIAARLGVPVETARTRVKRGLERLRARLDAQNAHRRNEFLAVLAPLTLGRGLESTILAAHAFRTIKGVWMGTNSKLLTGAAVALAAGLVWLQPWSDVASERSELTQAGAQALVGTVADDSQATASIETAGKAHTDARVALAGVGRAAGESQATWVVRGRVRRNRDEPFPGVDLRLTVETGYEGPGETVHEAAVRANENGAFEVAWMPPTVAVRVRANAAISGYYVSSSEVLVVPGGGAPQDLLVTAYALDVVLRGRVLDARGAPIGDAHVDCFSQEVVTDSAGLYEVRSSSVFGTANVSAWASGFAEEERTVDADTPSTIEGVDFRLSADRTLRGRVVDENARPVEGAQITSFSLRRVRAESGSDGRFTLAGLRSDKAWLSLGLHATGFTRLRVTYQDGAPVGTELEFVLIPGVDVAGRVVDGDGRGLPGANVYAGNTRFDVDVVTTVAGDDGRFLLRDLSRATKTLNVEVKGFAPLVKEVQLPASGPATQVLVIMSRGLEVAGLVVDPSGVPIARVIVSVKLDRDYLANLRATTNAHGRFRLANVPHARGLALEFYASERVRESVALDPLNASEVRVVLEHAAGLVGRVVDQASRRPVEAFRVRFVTAEPRPGDAPLSGYGADWASPGREFRSATGAWSVDGEELAAGAVIGLEVSAPGYGPTIVARAVTSLEPEQNPIVVTLGPGARLSGFVVDRKGGRPIEGASVRVVPKRLTSSWAALNDDENKRNSARTDAAGGFVLADLAVEPVSLFVEHEGYAPILDGPFDVASANPARTIELSPGATLRGVLSALDASAVPNATVNVSTGGAAGQPYRSWSLQTDNLGQFELRDLAPAVYQIARTLRHDRGAVFDLSRNVTVAGEGVVEVELRPGGRCQLRGSLRGGETPRLATVSAFATDPADPKVTHWRAAVAHDGRFEIDGLTPGTWHLSVIEVGAATQRIGSAEVPIAAEATGEVSVTVDLKGP